MSSNGSSKLASVLQKRMKNVMARTLTVNAEMGSIVTGRNLKIDSLPEFNIPPDNYYVCSRYIDNIRIGDSVLVIWANDSPVVVDKVKKASKI